MFARAASCFFACLLLASLLSASGESTPREQPQPGAAKAKQLFLDVCTSCHDLKRVRDQRWSREEWQGLIKGMISEGAAVTDEEFATIVTYLAENFGPGNP